MFWKGDDRMFGNDRPNQDDTVGENSDHGVCPIGDVLAELLDRYRAQCPELNVIVVEQPSAQS